jgi:hypothetical protein
VFLFRPADSVRVRRSLNTDTPYPADEPMAENPPDGAIIDYYLGASSPVTIEILDSAGKLVRRFTSSDKPWITPEELQKQAIPPYWVDQPKNPATTTGMHRWVWDLHYPTPTSVEHEYPISAVPNRTPQYPLGPWAMPGTYTVRLTANGQTLTAPLTVTLDPRIKTPQAGIASMFDLQMRLADMLTRSSQAVLRAKAITGDPKTTAAIKQQVEALLSGAQPTKKTEETPSKKPPAEKPPTLSEVQGAVATLYGAIERADATPTAAQVQAVNETSSKFDAVMKQWEALQKP